MAWTHSFILLFPQITNCLSTWNSVDRHVPCPLLWNPQSRAKGFCHILRSHGGCIDDVLQNLSERRVKKSGQVERGFCP